jgi:hypothetical protein
VLFLRDLLSAHVQYFVGEAVIHLEQPQHHLARQMAASLVVLVFDYVRPPLGQDFVGLAIGDAVLGLLVQLGFRCFLSFGETFDLARLRRE